VDAQSGQPQAHSPLPGGRSAQPDGSPPGPRAERGGRGRGTAGGEDAVNFLPWLIVVGALAGAGIALFIAELRPAPPELGAALERLHATPDPGRRPGTAEESATPRLDRLGERLLEVPGTRIPTRELALIGRTPARFMAHKLLFALLGLLLP